MFRNVWVQSSVSQYQIKLTNQHIKSEEFSTRVGTIEDQFKKYTILNHSKTIKNFSVRIRLSASLVANLRNLV